MRKEENQVVSLYKVTEILIMNGKQTRKENNESRFSYEVEVQWMLPGPW